ncbi:MAG: hypothetical protein WCJ66_18750, partial [Verrucomicrobiota bacterium]
MRPHSQQILSVEDAFGRNGWHCELVEGREVPWSLLVKDMPKSKHQDIDFIVDQLDWDKNVDPDFGAHNFMR